MSVLQKSKQKVSSRKQIAIRGVKDGILLLPGNQSRVVLETSSINFELKSEAEQDALIDVYQSFLNSLACPLQILVRIRELDLDKYLENFQHSLTDESEDVYKLEAANYTEFIKSLVTTNKILARRFYVVIGSIGKETDFELVKQQLALNTDIVTKGLARLGIHSRQLTSLELLDLFYSFYSPAQAKHQPLTEQMLELLDRSYL